ncbi:site-specific integrase [Mariniflexile sp.]|uniref:site-specific integrase n=1 Tax=Mariniflexile sp. TaxID=1979402 RepID=UPI004047B8F5
MDTEKEIKSLIRDCVDYLREEGYSEPRIKDYHRLWRDGIQEHMKKNFLVDYHAMIGENFLDSMPIMSASHMRAIRRSVNVLDDFLFYGKIRKRSVRYVHHELPGKLGEVVLEFIDSLERLRRCKPILNKHRRILSYFIAHLTLRSVYQVSAIGEDDVLTFISSVQNCKDKYLSTIRMFCRFLYQQKYIDRNVEYVIGRNNYRLREKLPSVYNADEIRRIENTIEQSSAVGKRDYAMLVLATRLGLRSSDIAGLTFGNLDWEHNLISLVQCKTKKIIELPLLADVGEAIINYLKYGRPISGFQQVFLTASAPYRPVNSMIISGAVSRTIKASGVDIKGRKFGPHAMRHTLASQLLRNGTSLPVISETLGHSDTQVTMNYLRMDINSLMQCALDVPLIPINFYEQKGGVFYG